MGALGLKYETPIANGKARLSFSSVLSASDDERSQADYDGNQSLTIFSKVNPSRMLFANHLKVVKSIGLHQLTFGTQANYASYSNELITSQFSSSGFKRKINNTMLSPYASIDIALSNRLSFVGGVNINHIFNREDQLTTVDLRGLLSYTYQSSKFFLSVGEYSQQNQPDHEFLTNVTFNFLPYTLSSIKSRRYIATFFQKINRVEVSIEGFYYHFPTIQASIPWANFRTDGVGNIYMKSQIEASSYGTSINLEQGFNNDFYYKIGGTLFNSVYQSAVEGLENYEYNTRSSINFVGREKLGF